MKKLVIPLGLFAAFAGAPASAGPNMSTDLAAPYVHLAPTSTYTTHYVITNPSSANVNVTVQCYSTSFRLSTGAIPIPIFSVGPGTSYVAAPNAINVFDPVTLGLTSSPNFSGLGWCYFAANQKIAVTYLMGAAVNGNLIPTDAARGISLDTAQSYVTAEDASVPYWTREAGWKSWIIAVNPTNNSNLNFRMRVYNTFGNLEGTYFAASSGPFASTVNEGKGMTVEIIPSSVNTSALFGSAQIAVDTISNGIDRRGFMGWVVGYNTESNESFQYAVTLDKDDVSPLAVSDR